MKRTLLFVCAVLLVASLAVAGAPNTYQVTGPVLELKEDMIVVQKGAGEVGDRPRQGHEGHGGPQGRLQGHHRVPDDRDDDRGQGREGKGDEEEITPRPAPSSA